MYKIPGGRVPFRSLPRLNRAHDRAHWNKGGAMKSMKWFVPLFVVTVLISMISGPAVSQTASPLLVNFQGEVNDPATGTPLPDGNYDMAFRIYDMEFGGTFLWKESHSSATGNAIPVQNGRFGALLGSGAGTGLSTALFNGPDRWLEILIEGETLEPRQRLTSVAYSLVSENSRLLNGREASAFANASHLHSGSDIASGIVSETWIDPSIARDSELASHAADSAAHHKKTTSFADLNDSAADGQIPAGIARDAEILPTVLAGDGSGSGLDADRLDGLDSSDLLFSSTDYGRSGVAANLYEGTQTLTTKYVNAAGPDSVEGSSSDVMFFVRNSGTGYALNCQATSYAVRGYSSGEDGYGVYGICHGDQGRGVVGSSTGFYGRGVWGSSGGENGSGVVGTATNTGDFANHGGYFEAGGGAGHGATCVATGSAGIGVYAEGKAAGVYSQGDVEVHGDLEVTGAYQGTFPRPAYDSGWQSVAQGTEIILTHKLGGDPDRYVVDMQFMSLDKWGQNQRYYGGERVESMGLFIYQGAWWHGLTKDDIRVFRETDDIYAAAVRVRIWVYK
jgi:hypothetical protein